MEIKLLTTTIIAALFLTAAPANSASLEDYPLLTGALAGADTPSVDGLGKIDRAYIAFRGRGGGFRGGHRGGFARGGGHRAGFAGGGHRGGFAGGGRRGGFAGGGGHRGGFAGGGHRGGFAGGGRRGGFAGGGQRGGYAYHGRTWRGAGGWHGGGYRWGGGWYRPVGAFWGVGGAVAAGAALGFVSSAAAASWAGAPPGDGYCWYYTDASKTKGFWDVCPQ